MWHMIHKLRNLKLQQLPAELKDLNNLLPHFLGFEKFNIISQEVFNKILIHAVSHGWENSAMILGFNFEGDAF